MKSFSFLDAVKIVSMQDGSGYSLFNGYSGNTAFLHSQHPETEEAQPDSLEPLPRQISADLLQQRLGMDEKKSHQLIEWLKINRFFDET